MSKSNFFTGQPVFNQLLNFIPRSDVRGIARELNADRYYKCFRTYEHLVTMLYCIFNQCSSLREVTTGLLAWEHRIHHLGMGNPPRRSTLSDANKNRSHEVFEKIYFRLLARYKDFLADSRKCSLKNNFYIFDATSIALFQEILKGSGLSKADGRRKGGIKVHTLLHARSDMPTMIRYSPSAGNDSRFLKEVRLPKGSVIVFDKGYHHYDTYNRFSKEHITWVTRLRERTVYQISHHYPVNEYQRQMGIQTDCAIQIGHTHSGKATKVKARMIRYYDAVGKRAFCFITNNFKLAPLTIARYYQQRWQIETFFKRIKQNHPLHYFLGDNENAIKIQIWCALIADLLLKVIRKRTGSTMAFSNITGLVRLHLMTYIDLKSFLQHPESSLLRKFKQQKKQLIAPLLFSP